MPDRKDNKKTGSSAGSSQKTVSGEQAAGKAPSLEFLKQVETKRLDSPCLQQVDMRKRVSKPCKKFVFGNQIHYLDEISFAIFGRYVREAKGVFTQRAYEAIINGQHVNKDTPAAAKPASAPSVSAINSATNQSANTNNAKVAQVPSITQQIPSGKTVESSPRVIHFGYYKKRQEGRLQYVTKIMLITDRGRAYEGVTLDLSVNGLKVSIKGVIKVVENQEVMITFVAFAEENSGVGLENIAYKVRQIESKDGKVNVMLVRTGGSDQFCRFVHNFVTTMERRYRLDPEDDYQEASAIVFEQMYTNNLAQIPCFIGNNDDGKPIVQDVAITEHNRSFVDFFASQDGNYDFSFLNIPGRIDHAVVSNGLIIITFRGDKPGFYTIRSMASNEFDSLEAQEPFIFHALKQSDCRILKLVVDEIHMQGGRIDTMNAALQDISEESSADLKKRIQGLNHVGMLVDVTAMMAAALGIDGTNENDETQEQSKKLDKKNISYWIGGSKKLYNQKPVRHFTRSQLTMPDIVRFGYSSHRGEIRYLAKTAVEMAVGKVHAKGLSQDISYAGLCVQFEEELVFEIGASAMVALPSLQKKRFHLAIKKMPFTVVKVIPATGKTTVMLARCNLDEEDEDSIFFNELIETNKSKLTVDDSDICQVAKSRVYQNLLAVNLPVVPLFVSSSDEQDASVYAVGISENPCIMASFFLNQDGDYDFSSLNTSTVTADLFGHSGQRRRKSHKDKAQSANQGINLYLYKVMAADQHSMTVHVKTDDDFFTAQQKQAFMRSAVASGQYCFVRMTSMPMTPLDVKFIDKSITKVRTNSRHKAQALRREIAQISGLSEIIDITEFIVV